MRFSERYGYKPVREIIQKESMDDDLQTGIWNVIYKTINENYIKNSNVYNLGDSPISNWAELVWSEVFKYLLSRLPEYIEDVINEVEREFLNLDWHQVYSFTEFTLQSLPLLAKKEDFIKNLNTCLETENSAYKVINDQLTLIISDHEILSIEEALEKSNPYSGVQQHLQQALILMSDRQNPNYSKSMHESISAVEGLARAILKNDSITLGDATAEIHKQYGLNKILMVSLSKLYGYTSNENGIRHGSTQESKLNYIDAKFMLVACTNFINYLMDKTKDQNQS